MSPGSMEWGGGRDGCGPPVHNIPSHRHRILVQFLEINTIGGNQCVAAGLLAAVVAHGLARSAAAFNVGRISLCVAHDGLMA